jgi:CO/xanthine dehydrogenase Mo-binding subunit
VSILGTRVLRTEDPRFLTTGGVYTDDVADERLAGACHVHFVRSAVAHARIASADVSGALQAPGVIAAFTGADLDLDELAPAPMEGRAAAAAWDAEGRLTAWIPNQGAQGTRSSLAAMLGIGKAAVRIITPDVGGAFGAKFGADPEHALVCWVARRLGRPARWAETRNENLIGMTHVTAWAMLASDELGIPVDKITVKWGDTDLIPEGGGTGGSRSLQQGGAAVQQAARELIDMARERARASGR